MDMGAVAAAAIIHKEKEIVASFRAAKAVSPSAAKTPATLGVHEGIALNRLRARAVLREAGDGRLYLDEPSWEALRLLRRRLALVMLMLVVALGVVAYLAARK
jgi:hypothetical protein